MSLVDKLKKLAELRDAGALTQDEFDAEKARLIEEREKDFEKKPATDSGDLVPVEVKPKPRSQVANGCLAMVGFGLLVFADLVVLPLWWLVGIREPTHEQYLLSKGFLCFLPGIALIGLALFWGFISGLKGSPKEKAPTIGEFDPDRWK